MCMCAVWVKLHADDYVCFQKDVFMNFVHLQVYVCILYVCVHVRERESDRESWFLTPSQPWWLYQGEEREKERERERENKREREKRKQTSNNHIKMYTNRFWALNKMNTKLASPMNHLLLFLVLSRFMLAQFLWALSMMVTVSFCMLYILTSFILVKIHVTTCLFHFLNSVMTWMTFGEVCAAFKLITISSNFQFVEILTHYFMKWSIGCTCTYHTFALFVFSRLLMFFFFKWRCFWFIGQKRVHSRHPFNQTG